MGQTNDINFEEMATEDLIVKKAPKTDKIEVSEEDHPEKKWFKEAHEIKTEEELTKFIHHLLNDYIHDYGTVCHAIASCAYASACLGANIEGITGFQAGFIMWDFIRHWSFSNNKCGLRIIDYDDILYPQNEKKFEKIIDKDFWENIQEEASKRLNDSKNKNINEKLKEHWQNIVNGIVPFGYKISEENG